MEERNDRVQEVSSRRVPFIIFSFKNHMVDLVFIEKVARWLTNTQVKIKTEVADSNAQAKRLAQHINDIDRRIDACERPNLDTEVRPPSLPLQLGFC